MFSVRADTRAVRIRASLVVIALSGLTYSGVQHLAPLLHREIPLVPATILDQMMPYSGWALIPYASLVGLLLTALPSLVNAGDDEVLEFVGRNRLYGKGLGLIDVHLLASCVLARQPILTFDVKLGKSAAALGLRYA